MKTIIITFRNNPTPLEMDIADDSEAPKLIAAIRDTKGLLSIDSPEGTVAIIRGDEVVAVIMKRP